MINECTRIECMETDEIIIIKRWLSSQKGYLCEIWNITYNPDGSYGRDLFGGPDYQILTEIDLKRRGANV